MARKRRAAAGNEPDNPRTVPPAPGKARQQTDPASGVLPRLRAIAGQLQEVIARLESVVGQLAGSRAGDHPGALMNDATAGEENDWRGRAMIFLRQGAVGHVGWGFECGDGTWSVGAVENPSHGLRTRADHIGWWSHRVRDPIAAMRDHQYDQCKVVAVHNPRGASAEAKAQELRGQPFNIVDHNCEHDTYHVLTAYGARLPHPGQPQNLTPLAWFHHVPAAAYSLADAPEPDGMVASRPE